MSGSREVELKFLCAPSDLGAVLAAAPEGDDDSRELISVYFDTPDLALQKAGASLRVRESKGRRVLTMKRGDGLSREEYEAAIEGEQPPDRARAPCGRSLTEDDAAALKPAFNVRVMPPPAASQVCRARRSSSRLTRARSPAAGGCRRSARWSWSSSQAHCRRSSVWPATCRARRRCT